MPWSVWHRSIISYTAAQLIEAGHTDTLLVSHFDGDAGQAGNQASVTG